MDLSQAYLGLASTSNSAASGSRKIRSVYADINSSLGVAKQTVVDLSQGYLGLASSSNSAASGSRRVRSVYADINSSLGVAKQTVVDLSQGYLGLASSSNSAASGSRKIRSVYADINSSLGVAKQTVVDLSQAYLGLASTSTSAAAAAKKVRAAYADVNTALGVAKQATVDLGEAYLGLNSSTSAAASSAKKIHSVFTDMGALLGGVKKAANDAGDAYLGLGSAAKSAANSMKRAASGTGIDVMLGGKKPIANVPTGAMHGPNRQQLSGMQSAYRSNLEKEMTSNRAKSESQFAAELEKSKKSALKADADVQAARDKTNQKYLAMLKYNSKILEDQQKKEQRDAKKTADEKIKETKRVQAEQEKIRRQNERAAKKSVFSPQQGGSGLGGGLTARADIYMHANAMRSLTDQSKGMMDMFIRFQQNRVAIQAFTGSAQQAATVMKEIQDYALASPYQTVQLAEAARNMMAYGRSSKDTIATMKMLGDVAGGSQQRLDLLMYAMSQITSLGKLQGNELRQLTEQGFNPLVTIAEQTKKPYETMEQAMLRVNKAKEAGLISANDVTEALKAETSAGGRFADMANKMNNEVGGLANQLRELFQKIGMSIIGSLEDDMKKALTKAIELGKAISAWFDDPNNYETVRQIGQMIKLAGIAILTFHGVGLAVAMVRWQLASAWSTLKGLSVVLLPIKLVLRSIVPIVTMLFQAFMFLLSPVGLIVAAIGLAAAGIIYFSGAGSEMLSFLSDKFQELGSIAVPVIQGITKALMQGQFQEAGQLAMLGLELAFRVGFREIYGIGRSFITGFLNAWTNMYTGLAVNTVIGFTRVVNAFATTGVVLQNTFSHVVLMITNMWDQVSTYIEGKWLYIKSFFDRSIDYNKELETLNKAAEDRKITREEDFRVLINQRALDVEKANQSRLDSAQGMGKIMEKEAATTNAAREKADAEAVNAFDSRIGTIKTEMADVMQTIKRGTEEMGPPKPEPPKGSKYQGKYGTGALGGGVSYKASDAMSAYSGDYTKKAAEQAERVRQMRAGGPSQTPTVTQLITANTLLQLIAKNTAIGQTVVQAAGFTTP